MIKVDLHTHSIASPDGGLTLDDYIKSPLGQIAITDHNRIDFALYAREKLGDKIIVGEEIKTTDGEIIGLFLTQPIEPGLTPRETCIEIREQNGVIYIPHPFETMRSGITHDGLDEICDLVDIVEVANGRAYYQNYGRDACKWVKQYKVSAAASSDAHGRVGWGKTYTRTKKLLTRKSIVEQLRRAEITDGRVGVGVLYPKINRLRKVFSGGDWTKA